MTKCIELFSSRPMKQALQTPADAGYRVVQIEHELEATTTKCAQLKEYVQLLEAVVTSTDLHDDTTAGEPALFGAEWRQLCENFGNA